MFGDDILQVGRVMMQTVQEIDRDIETETKGSYNTTPSQLSEDGDCKSSMEGPSMADLLLSHHPTQPLTGAGVG